MADTEVAKSTASPAAQLNSRAQNGFANSAAYDQHRPTYSPTIVQFLLERLGVAGKHGASIVDLGAGTGKFTELLAGREEAFDVIAVEPHGDMRRELERKALKNVTVQDGFADNVKGVKDESVDAVVVAQAFHWFANKIALKELHRIIKPRGALGLVWNVEDYNNAADFKATTTWEQKLHDLTWQVQEETGDPEPRFRHLKWKEVFDEQISFSPLNLIRASEDQLFSLPIGEHAEPFEARLSKDQVWDRYRTLGHISVLEGAQLERVKKTFDEAIEQAELDENGKVVVHGNTYAVWTTKIPTEGRAGVPEEDDVGIDLATGE